jgi:hypothetical protein
MFRQQFERVGLIPLALRRLECLPQDGALVPEAPILDVGQTVVHVTVEGRLVLDVIRRSHQGA